VRLLVLGGTRFLGRHLVDAALARRYDVTIFTRGRTPIPWHHGVARRAGNRDPEIAPGLDALEQGSWDGLIDTSGYVPRCVGASARLLADRVGHGLFVSSLSVYADTSHEGQNEDAPVGPLADPATEDVAAHYGPLKAACEHEFATAFAGRTTIVRPGLIVGPHDPTDRFSYWVARFAQPEVLGGRGPRAVVPSPRERGLQFIDARDLAEWMLDLVASRIDGTYNAVTPPGSVTMGALVDALTALARSTGRATEPAWIDDARLVARDVVPWTELPLWLPASDHAMTGFMSFSCARALGHGLRFRALEGTLADTAAWLAQREHAGAWREVLSRAKEDALLQDAAAGGR
jgi:2'-hydroxyisoflavone reductase